MIVVVAVVNIVITVCMPGATKCDAQEQRFMVIGMDYVDAC